MARPKLGETETERMQLKITTAEIAAIDDWRFANRVPSRSEAVRRLCRIALIQQELAPSLHENMKGLIDAVILLGDETLQDRPRTPEELDELRAIASDVFKYCYSLYDKLVEQTVRLDGLSNGDTNLSEALDWEGRAADYLKGRSLFEGLRKSPEAMDVIAQAAEKARSAKKDENR
ncbi:hypothetical protein GOC76_25345 [Sinorhizobium medicae]|nr:hypothetical protein [Sinorhizobium medicae]